MSEFGNAFDFPELEDGDLDIAAIFGDPGAAAAVPPRPRNPQANRKKPRIPCSLQSRPHRRNPPLRRARSRNDREHGRME